MKSYNFDEAYNLFLSICEDYGVEIKEGTGQFLKDGESYDVLSAIRSAFSNQLIQTDPSETSPIEVKKDSPMIFTQDSLNYTILAA